jgi:hypothetical protein
MCCIKQTIEKFYAQNWEKKYSSDRKIIQCKMGFRIINMWGLRNHAMKGYQNQ